MKAIPRQNTASIRRLLPNHLHGGTGGEPDRPFPPPDGSSRGQHHAPIPELLSNARGSTLHPTAEADNRQLNADILNALNSKLAKHPDPADLGVPRFVIVWRMYPNSDNPVVKSGDPDKCGCGCSCGG
jgi:hypothetical protein